MNGRQFSFGISGHPLAQILATIVMGIVLVAAVFMGAFLLMGLLGLAVIGYVVFWVRAWWRLRTPGGRGPSGRGPGPGRAQAIRYIEAEYEVVEANADPEADAARRRRPDNR